MKYEHFSEVLDNYREGQKMISELYSIGMDFMEGKYKISDVVYNQMVCSFKSHYNEEGVDWILWFIFENDYGKKNWNKIKSIKKEEPRKLGEGAWDPNGEPIFYSYESSWDYLEKNCSIK
jgi:hypothetical protein